MAYLRKTGDIFISDEIKEVLTQIENDSAIAKSLLKQRHPLENLCNDYVNYISISTQNRFRISYLTQERIDSMSQDEFWTSSRRFNARPGSVIKKIFPNFSEKEIDNFITLYRTIISKPNFEFKVVKGDDIKKYYHYSNYCDNSSSLGASCMKHDSCQDFLDVYTQNQDKVSLLIMVNSDDKILGRAILWNLPDIKVMDRIYTIDDNDLTFYFKKWAQDNGYFYKKEQKWNNTLYFVNPDGNMVYLELSVKIDNINKFENYPYFDTFKFYSQSKKRLYNFIPESGFDYILSSPDGSKQDTECLSQCIKSKLFYYKGDTNYIQYLNGRVFSGDLHYSDVNDTYIYKDDCEWSEEIRDYIFCDSMKELNNLSAIEKRKKYIKVNHDSYLKDSLSYYESDLNSLGVNVSNRLYESPIIDLGLLD